MTALVLRDFLGGELVLGEVLVAGERTGYHWWNRFADGDADLTREQFHPHEIVTAGRIFEAIGPPKRCREEYQALRHRVLGALGERETAARSLERGGYS